MPISNENLQFLICRACNGLGHVQKNTCQVCHGKGIIAYLSGNLLFWDKKVNQSYIKLYKIESIFSKIIFIILMAIALAGLASLAYSIYLVGPNLVMNRQFWLKGLNSYYFYFWLSLIFDLFLFYFLSLAKAKREKVITKKYEDEMKAQLASPPPIDWSQVASFKHKNVIDISKSFSAEALNVIYQAFLIAQKYKALEVGSIHYFIAALLYSQKTSNIFFRLGLDLKELSQKLARVAAKYPQSEGLTYFSSQSVKVLLKSYRLAYENKLETVDVTDILHESIKADKLIQEVLIDMKITLDKVDNVIMWFQIKRLLRQQWLNYRTNSRLKSKTGIDRAMTAIQTSNLNRYSDDLTLLAKMGYLGLSINRDKEYAEMFRILEGSSIKASILVGESGVGKSAMIEGLAQKMIADDVPDFLKDKRLVSLSISRLIAGASVSVAKERLLIAINEIAISGNVVLFIDNIHEIMGIPGGGEGSVDLADVLVEGLNKHLFILLATSDTINYSRYVENNSLGNIMKKIDVVEPDANLAIKIIEGKIGQIEAKNNVYFSYDAIDKAVNLSDRYIHDKFLPYKAITLIEEIAVWAKSNKGANYVISGNDVATLLSEKIDMPVTEASGEESAKLLRLEEIIHENMVDQEEAVSAVADSLRRARAELRDIKRPIANLLFLGPTGVGKTQLAKTIAKVYFGDSKDMVRIDMSEYQDTDSIARLLGSPSSSKGAGSGGQLTEAVRKNPYTILLLDELEKAHPDILNIFLQVMDDGRLTDATGRTVDFTNVILIATSNAQTQFIQEQVAKGVPVEEIKRQLMETELKQFFKPEFLNRFDNVIVFKPLEFEDIVKITNLLLKDVAQNLEAKGINFQATKEAVRELAKAGFDPQYGARPLRRAIQDRVDNALAQYLLTGQISRRDLAVLEEGGKIRIEKAKQL